MDQSLVSSKAPHDLLISESIPPALNLSDYLPISTLSKDQQKLLQSLNSVDHFKIFLKSFYKDFGFDSNKTQAAVHQIDYLYNLFLAVHKIGGWRTMNGTNSWSSLSKTFGSMQGAKLREDYENFLFALEKVFGLQNYDSRTIESLLIDLDPEKMVICEWYQPSLWINEVNKVTIQRFLNLDSTVAPQFVNEILGVDIEKFSKEEMTAKKTTFPYSDTSFLLQDLLGFDSFYVESPLETFLELYEEISNKMISLLHWNSKENLLRYSQNIAGVSSPLLIVMKNSYTLIGGPSYLSLNGVFLVLQGECEFFGIHSDYMKVLSNKAQRDFGVNIFQSVWKPTEQYLIVNGIEFFYIKSKGGDAVVCKTDFVYWIISDFCVVIDWFLLPSFRIEESAALYKETRTDPHKFNLPLLCIEYLNLHMTEVTEEMLLTMKKVVSEGVDEEYWTGNFVPELIDYRSCSICNKDIVWRYARCPTCVTQSLLLALCLKCGQEHKCKTLEYFEKFSTQELEKFYNRLEKRSSESVQGSLCKVALRPAETGAGDSLKYNPEKLILKTEVCPFPSQPVPKPNEKTNEAPAAVNQHWDLEQCYKKLGRKKQKIREAMENPLSGPRFTYEFEPVRKTEEPNLPALKIPIPKPAKKNPLSQLVTNQKGTALSSLIRIDRKKELELKRRLK